MLLNPNYKNSNRGLPPVGQAAPLSNQNTLLAKTVTEIQNNIQAPPPLILSSVLTILSIAFQGVWSVKKPSHEKTPISLMVLILAKSGERKSTIEKLLMKAIIKFQNDAQINYKKELKTWERKNVVWESRHKLLLKKVSENEPSGIIYSKLIEHENKKPQKPKKPKLVYDDTTPQALFNGLNENTSNAGLISSEGGSILHGGALNDIPKLNAIWSGDKLTIDRKTAQSFELTNTSLTISIMSQRVAFDKYMLKNGELSRGSGLWARFLVCEPSSTQGTRFIYNTEFDWKNCNKFNLRITEILTHHKDLILGRSNDKYTVEFDDNAKSLWVKTYNQIESEIRINGRFDQLEDHASKLADNIARIAALIHLFENDSNKISEITLQAAIEIAAWYSDEFARMFLPTPQEEQDAILLDEWFQSHRLSNNHVLKKNHIRQFGPNQLRDKKRLDNALNTLVQNKCIFMFVDNTGTTQVNLSPYLNHQMNTSPI